MNDSEPLRIQFSPTAWEASNRLERTELLGFRRALDGLAELVGACPRDPCLGGPGRLRTRLGAIAVEYRVDPEQHQLELLAISPQARS